MINQYNTISFPKYYATTEKKKIILHGAGKFGMKAKSALTKKIGKSAFSPII
jgi:isopentenyl phosphate kinase